MTSDKPSVLITGAGICGLCSGIALAKAGHRVTIVSGPVSVRYPKEANVVPVVTTGEMLQACLERLPSVAGVIATAAPCDFEPVSRVAGKMPRQRGLNLSLKPTRDVIATLARRAVAGQWMVAFALEPDGNPARALEKITAKRCDLIVLNAIGADPAAPLLAVDWPKIAVLIGPFVPNRDPVFVEIANIRIAGQKPQKLVDDALEEHLFRGDEGKAFREVEAHLVTENTNGSGTCAVAFLCALFQDAFNEIVVLLHVTKMVERRRNYYRRTVGFSTEK